MRPRTIGLRPYQSLILVAARLSVIGATLAVSACASTSERRYAGAYQPAAAQPVAERPWKTEIEEDGKPAQVPPIRRARPEEDDPSQPWSPNYGERNPQPPAVRTPHQAWPKPIETSIRTSEAKRPLSEAEAEIVMARAINAHENRRP